MMQREIRPALIAVAIFTVLTGVAYPLAVTVVARVVFPNQTGGSIIIREGRAVGSSLIGQPFDDPKYFWGRPSATGPFPYNAAASSGSNLGPTNKALAEAVKKRIDALRAADPSAFGAVPPDLVTASGSGLDPHISPAAAEYQVRRVARARSVPEETIRGLVRQFTHGPQFGFLGDPRVHVLELNLALDR